MFDLRDELVCDGLARLTTSTLEKIRRTAEDGDSAFSRQDAMRKAANARASIVGYGDDVRVFIEAVKESMNTCLLYTSPSPRDKRQSRMPSSA